MASLFEAYITNLGKYNEGELVGETLKFPTTTEEVQALLKRIGVDGVRYEEFFITSFDGDVLGLYDYLTEYENLDELNYLACLLSELDQGELEKFEAVIDSGEHTSSVADLTVIIRPAWPILSIWRKTWIATSFIPALRTMKPWAASMWRTWRPLTCRSTC